ncbi:hypothetical protein DE146DRAFT_721986 [Phaeosphaeria sp. MPI-PUGE-AT-0046c]|nr:hypothetical protein DE146DRAFT_721986 [Phaeosphaeria sp. MPI-PUGE-AT-0046c]
MSSLVDAQAVEKIIGYQFRSGYKLLLEALTAAGSMEENWDGNRKLSQFGTGLNEFLLNYLAYEARATGAQANEFKKIVISNEQRACVAERTGINRHIRYSKRGGAQSPSVWGKAINAIIAAVFIDCQGNISVVLRAMQHLGLFNPAGQFVNPSMLSLEHQDSFGVTSLAQSLFGVNFDSHLPSATSNTHQAIVAFSSSMPSGMAHSSQTELQTDTLTGVVNDGGHSSRTQHDHAARGEWPSVVSMTGFVKDFSIFCAPFGGIVQKEPLRYDMVDAMRVPQTRKRGVHETNSTLRTKFPKCNRSGHRPPDERSLTPSIQETTRNLSEKGREVSAKILLNIASPCLMVALQEILVKYRTEVGYGALNITTAFSRMERLDVILSLDRGITIAQLRRRYHILALYKDCGGTAASNSQIVVATSSDFEGQLRRPGNPANKFVASLTKRMMQDMFPALGSGTDEYKTKYRLMSYLRRLGHRLDILEQRFGKGILGLIIDRGTTDPSVGITDAMITGLTNVEFSKLVDSLHESQGALLQSFSAAVLPVVQALTGESAYPQRLFKLEKVIASDIMRYSKGSQVLLELVSEAG